MATIPHGSTLPAYKYVLVSEVQNKGVAVSNLAGDYTEKNTWSLVPNGLAPYNLAPVTALTPANCTIKGQNATALQAATGGNILLQPGVGSGGNVSGNVAILDTAGFAGWNTAHLIIGIYHLWVDSSGRLRIKNSAPSSDTDGTIVGTQS